MKYIIPIKAIENMIYLIRGHRVMIDRDLAELYGVATKNLNKAVKRNNERFPSDFMFQLTKKEYNSLRFQIGTLKRGEHSKYLPNVFTEQGVAMLSSVLQSKKAIQVNIAIMRIFVKIKQFLLNNKEITLKLKELEQKIEKHDSEIENIFGAIRQLIAPPDKPKQRIGFDV